MNASWLKVIIASVFEVVWVIGLKHAEGFVDWAVTVIAIIISFTVMIRAGRTLPVGTVYAVFVGLGTAGTILSEILFFNEVLKFEKLVLIGVLLIGVIGLKLVTNDSPEKEGKQHGMDSIGTGGNL